MYDPPAMAVSSRSTSTRWTSPVTFTRPPAIVASVAMVRLLGKSTNSRLAPANSLASARAGETATVAVSGPS